jgi:hypothetical protein
MLGNMLGMTDMADKQKSPGFGCQLTTTLYPGDILY